MIRILACITYAVEIFGLAFFGYVFIDGLRGKYGKKHHR